MRTLHLKIKRGAPGREVYRQTYTVTLPEDAYLLDGVHKVYGEQDDTLMFRHGCHHASCGLCGARVNGRERLLCVTPVSEFSEGTTVRLDPLRNFPWIGDLVVDVKPMMWKMNEIEFPYVRDDELTEGAGEGMRFEDCIECGLCMSACPTVGSNPYYSGPAPLAMVRRLIEDPRGRDIPEICAPAASSNGAWRCHSVMECTEVCPSFVDPATKIGELRRFLLFHRR